MFRNCLSAAWANLVRNPWQSFIAIGGLALGLAAAILAGIVTVNQFTYNHFLPDYQRTYYVTMVASLPQRPNVHVFNTPHDLAALLQQNFPQIETATRMGGRVDHSLRRGAVETRENILEADPSLFQVLKFPVLFGQLDTALARPDGIVIPRSTAEKYFGRDNVVGQTLELDRQHPLTVTAVIEDLPKNATELMATIFTSSAASYSRLATLDRQPDPNRNGSFLVDSITLVRLKTGVAPAALEAQLAARKDIPPHQPGMTVALHLTRLDQYHLSPDFQPGMLQRIAILGTVAFVILFLACINFVNLYVARSTRRGLEIGIRKAAGAGRTALMVQFLGEAILYVLLALCAGVALAELGLPSVNAFLNAGAVFDYWRNPALAASLIGGTLAVGLLAGLYPALVLSSFRPQTVLKGLKQSLAGLGLVREALVSVQFAILIVLIIGAATLFQQYHYLTTQALRLDTDQTLFVHVSRCDGSFKDQVMALPGVRSVACSGQDMLNGGFYGDVKDRDGNNVSVLRITLGPEVLQLYDVKPLAGRFFSADHAGDVIPANAPSDFVRKVVINETAVKKLGLGSPEAAIGHTDFYAPGRRLTVIGVAPDFSLASSQKPIDPTAYFASDADLNPPAGDALGVLLHVKLDGRLIPETLAGIDRAWNVSGGNGPIERSFMSSYVENLWLSLLRESQAIFAFTGIAVFLACLGLFALSLSATEQRIKEIGIRKAMGATTGEIVILLLWDFGKPALWANVIAWPLAWWLMRRWLSGFAYHIDLALWPFLAASIAALVIALLTVMGHALLVARQKPVLALRYE